MDRYRRPTPRALPPGGPRSLGNHAYNRKTLAQSLVEFALLTPLLFIIIVGIIEFGWLFNNHMIMHFATHESARTGAVAGRYSDADTLVKAEARNDTLSLIYRDAMRLRIYKAGADGLCGSPCLEDVYEWNGVDWGLGPLTYTWPPSDRSDVEPTDNLGVEITYRHYFLINFLPAANGSVEIRDHSVIPVEPAFFTPPPQ